MKLLSPDSGERDAGGSLHLARRLTIHRATLSQFQVGTPYRLNSAGAKKHPELVGRDLLVLPLDAPGAPYSHRDLPNGAALVSCGDRNIFIVTNAAQFLEGGAIDYFGEDSAHAVKTPALNLGTRMTALLRAADVEHDALPRDERGFIVDPELDWYDNDDEDNSTHKPAFDWIDTIPPSRTSPRAQAGTR